MSVQRPIRRSALLVGGATVVAALVSAGCQAQFTAAGSRSAATTAASGSNGDTQMTTAGTTATSKAGTKAPPACTAASLTLRLGHGAGAGAGSRYPALQFTNVGTTPCVLAGFPGVSYVAGADGTQVGASAVRTGPSGGQVELTPGRTASSLVQEANVENYPPADCKPVPVRGFRVYAPGDTAAMFVPFPSADATACSSLTMPGGNQLSVRSVTAGTGDE